MFLNDKNDNTARQKGLHCVIGTTMHDKRTTLCDRRITLYSKEDFGV